MTSFFERAQTILKGKMHDLLDNVENTPSAYRQRIRDLEAALADLRAARDESAGTNKGYQRDIGKLESSKADKEASILLLLGDDDPSNDEHAVTLQLEVEEIELELAAKEELLTQNQAVTEGLDDAIDQLESKHREMCRNLSRITSTAAATSAKNRAAEAAEAASDAAGAARSVSVDNIERKLNAAADTADARFERVIGGLDKGDDPERAAALARAKAKLAEKRQAINAMAVDISKEEGGGTASGVAPADLTISPEPAVSST